MQPVQSHSFASRVRADYPIVPEVAACIQRFRNQRPWRGTIDERRQKFQSLHRELTTVLNLKTRLEFEGPNSESARSDHSGLDPRTDTIHLVGRLSVVTYFFLVIRATGRNSDHAMNFAANAFARFFPRSFQRCDTSGAFARKS